VMVNGQQFSLGNNTTIYDRFQNYATVTGNVTHQFFQDLRFNLRMQSPNFEVVHLQQAENPLFYGDAICNANFSVTGPPDNLNMTIRATPSDRSHIYLPIQYGDGITGPSSFLTFKAADS